MKENILDFDNSLIIESNKLTQSELILVNSLREISTSLSIGHTGYLLGVIDTILTLEGYFPSVNDFNSKDYKNIRVAQARKMLVERNIMKE